MDPGTLVEGRYRVIKHAGQGGFGTVYRAIDTSTARDVALKVFSRDQTDFARFEREVEALATVRHHHVVAYVGHGLTDDGSPYFAMEWLDGIDLARRLERGPLSLADALTIVLRAAQGLAHAHANGIVHRDVKPSNLFLVGDRPEEVRVIDFGVARTTGSFSRLTATGAVLGTPSYMAPEQARGAHDVTPRADVFALGTVLYECLTGTPAFDGASPHAILAKILGGALPRVCERRPEVPTIVDALLARMLAHEPGDRLADGAAAATAMSGLLAERGLDEGQAITPIPQRQVRVRATVIARSRSQLVDAEIDKLAAVATELGGELQRTSDTLLASFSARDPADAARRGTQCALAMRRQMPELAIAVVTLRRDTVAAPHAIESELGQHGIALHEGVIALDAATAKHVGGEFEVVVEGPLTIVRDVATTPSSVAVHLRGRAREVAALEGAFAAAVEDRCPGMVLVLGDEGLGKTALLDHVIGRLAARDDAPRVLRAHGDRTTSTSPFAVAGQLIRTRLGSVRTRDALRAALVADAMGKLDAEFACELAGFHGDAASTPHLAAARRDPLIMADACRAAWLAFVEAHLDAGPLIIAIDDLDLADPPSLHLIDVTMHQFADRCLLAIGTARPGRAASALAVFEQHTPQQVSLRPLRPHLARELVRENAPAAPDDMIDSIVERGAGNALHLVELARIAVVRETPPASIAGAVESRIARLDATVQRALHAASVFGLEFREAGVAVLVGGQSPSSALEVARRERLIAKVHEETDDRVWRFANALVQESIYASLTPGEREAAHAAAARWLESRGPSDPTVIAWHYERAADGVAALRWYADAARLALDGRDVERARALTERALACAPDGDSRARLLAIRAEAAFVGNDPSEGKRAALAAMDAARPGTVDWLGAVGLLITSAGQLGDNDAVEALANRIRGQVADPHGVGARAVCLCRAASQLYAVGRFAIARELTDEARRTAGPDLLAAGWLARMQAGFSLIDDQYDAAIDEFGEAVKMFAAAGDIRSSCQARIFKASYHIFAGDFEGAEIELGVADAMARRTGADYFAKWASYTRGKILALAGEPAVAREYLERVRGLLASSPRIVAGTHVFLGLAALRARDTAWAKAEAHAALAAHPNPSTRAPALAVLARALVGTDPEEAVRASDEAAAIVRENGALAENESVVHIAVAEACHAAGRHEAAREAVDAAARKLWRIASRLRTPERRESFLHRIEPHAATLRLAAQLGVPVGD